MSIPGITQNMLKEVLSENLTPSDSIKTPDRLFGREKMLKTIDRAFSSPGRQIFIFDDRGVGKTSLALTSAYLHTGAENQPIYVMCGKTNNFAQTIQAIGNAAIPVEKRLERLTTGEGLNVSVWGFGVGITKPSNQNGNIAPPQSLMEALDVIRYVASKRSGTTIIVIDEMERIEGEAERDKFAEFIRNIPELDANVRFVFCGIMHDIDELLKSHPSAGRILEAIELKRLHHSDLWKILTVVSEKLNVEIQQEALIRISQVSDGFPHYVHLIGEALFWSIFDDPSDVTHSESSHYKDAIIEALRRVEPSLRVQYEKATHKTRNTDDYEVALWALAYSTSDKRQISEIYDSSYKWIALKRLGKKFLEREQLNQRYLSMRKDSHGNIIAWSGSGWFAFRENIMRGYVRLRAEAAGINLGRHDNTAGMA